MTAVYVSFTDSSETTVRLVFPGPQSTSDYPNYAEIDSSDARFTAWQFGQLGRKLVDAATGTCNAVTNAIVPDTSTQNAYVLAYGLVGPSATVPTADPAKTIFAGMAAANGFQQPQAFAALVAGIGLASMGLQTILATLKGSVAAAKAATDLQTALATFQGSIASFVTALNTEGLTINVLAPAPILISGINV